MEISPTTSPGQENPAVEFTGYSLHGMEGCPLQKDDKTEG